MGAGRPGKGVAAAGVGMIPAERFSAAKLLVHVNSMTVLFTKVWPDRNRADTWAIGIVSVTVAGPSLGSRREQMRHWLDCCFDGREKSAARSAGKWLFAGLREADNGTGF